MKFTREPNRRCLRGLEFFYHLEHLEPQALQEAARDAFPGLWLGSERWGPLLVLRAVLNHRFELRIGARPGQVHMIHRATCPPQARRQDQEAFELLLGRL
jgi:hypothetical protein